MTSAGGANEAWLRRSLASVWHPCTQMKSHETLPLVPVARAHGVWLEDFEGRRLLDAVSSWWVNLFGHGEPRIRAAITAQLGELEHAMLAGFTHRPAVELAERLGSLAPRGLGHAFFASDGASATEIALKMSYHAWRNAGHAGKRRFVGLAGGYHGETLGALAVTDVAIFRDAYAPIVRVGDTVPTPDARLARDGRTPADVAREAGDALEAYLAEHHDSVAALIVEPLVQGASGMVMYDASYLKRARELCTRHRVHLIADEIMTGFGRTGTLFACEQAGIVPDLMLLSKGITGGFLPLACVLSTEAIFGAFYDDDVARGFLHSHSYSGNPLACRAALAVLDIFRDDDVIAANRAKAKRWDAIAAPLAAHAQVRDFRRCGMIVAFDVDTGRPDFARWCFAEGLARHLLLRPIGTTVYFMPPYVIDDDAFALLCERTREIVDLA
jgi:adenosylmethionine-8-amino-7-oxononanoate aminotransferase